MRRAASLLISLAAAPASPAAALDCARATTEVETAICADPAARAADAAMTSAYDALVASLAPRHRHALLVSQRRWLERRGEGCDDDRARSACLAQKTLARRDFLAGAAESGPGAPPPGLTPLFIQHVGEPGEYDIAVDALKFVDPASPGETLFNAEIDAMLKDVPAIQDKDIRAGQTYSYWLGVSVPFASDTFISAHTELYVFSGGAHGDTSTGNINIDLASGRRLGFDDMFAATASGGFETSCLSQIEAQKRERMPDDPMLDADSFASYRTAIAASVRDLTRWSFFATKAVIAFDASALGAYVEGAYSCEFPASSYRDALTFDSLAPAR